MDGTKDPKDTLGATPDPSTGEKGTSEQPKTYTEEEKAKAVSDALSAAGRIAKQLDQQREALEAERKQLTASRVQWQREKDEAELEAARDDPDALKSLRARQKQSEREAELDRREQELKISGEKHAEALKGVAQYTKERNAHEIAARLNVDFELLMKFTDGSTEAMEELAKALPKKGEATILRPDSGRTIGGGSIPTNLEQFKKWIESISQAEYEKLKPQIDEMRASGKIK